MIVYANDSPSVASNILPNKMLNLRLVLLFIDFFGVFFPPRYYISLNPNSPLLFLWINWNESERFQGFITALNQGSYQNEKQTLHDKLYCVWFVKHNIISFHCYWQGMFVMLLLFSSIWIGPKHVKFQKSIKDGHLSWAVLSLELSLHQDLKQT